LYESSSGIAITDTNLTMSKVAVVTLSLWIQIVGTFFYYFQTFYNFKYDPKEKLKFKQTFI